MATVTLAAALAVAVLAPPAAGSPTAPEGFDWQAPAGCPDANVVRGHVDDLLGASTAATDAVGVAGRIALTNTGYALQLTIAVGDTLESRRVESEDCALLARAAGLLVAITVDAIATAKAIEQAEAAERDPGDADPLVPPPRAQTADASVAVQTEPAPAPVRVDGPPTTSPTRAPPRHGIEGALAGGLGVALVPGVTGGLEGMIGWRYGPVRVRAIGFHWFSRPARLRSDAAAGAALSGGGLRGCYAARWPRVEVPVCVGPDVAALHGAGFGTAVDSQRFADVWIALATGVGVEVRLSRRVSLIARAEALIGLRRPAIHLDAGDVPIELFRAPPAGFRLVLGASVHSR